MWLIRLAVRRRLLLALRQLPVLRPCRLLLPGHRALQLQVLPVHHRHAVAHRALCRRQ